MARIHSSAVLLIALPLPAPRARRRSQRPNNTWERAGAGRRAIMSHQLSLAPIGREVFSSIFQSEGTPSAPSDRPSKRKLRSRPVQLLHPSVLYGVMLDEWGLSANLTLYRSPHTHTDPKPSGKHPIL